MFPTILDRPTSRGNGKHPARFHLYIEGGRTNALSLQPENDAISDPPNLATFNSFQTDFDRVPTFLTYRG